MKKVTWKKIRRDFKNVYPNLSKMSVYYKPYGYAQIVVYLSDGIEVIYDYDLKRAWVLPERWKDCDY